MAKKSPARSATSPTYPSLGAHLATRREFLRTMGVGVLISAGAAPLVACGGGMDAGGMVDPMQTIRMPASGFVQRDLGNGASLGFAIRLTVSEYATYTEESVLAAAGATLDSYTCESLGSADPAELESAVEAAVRQAVSGEIEGCTLVLGQCVTTE